MGASPIEVFPFKCKERFYIIHFFLGALEGLVVMKNRMGINIGLPKEIREGEKRVALSPDSVGRLLKLGFSVHVEKNAGLNSFFTDAQYEKAGAKLEENAKSLYENSQILLKVQIPTKDEISFLKESSTLVSFIFPHRFPEEMKSLQEKKIHIFAMEKIPRVTRAQNMDALSSQATVAGYRAALHAADLCPRFFPMLTTAAGTIRPSKVLVMGAGVAGLQAIATARRLGAIVEGYDVRASAREQVESLGARFISSSVNAEAQGGYARELSAEEKAQDAAKLAEHISQSDVVITTAQIPGKAAPILLNEETILKMKPGSVVIDLAAEGGGNCSLTQAGKLIEKNQIKIFGPINLPSELPIHASEMYSKNIFNFIEHLTQGGKTFDFNLKDEIISGALL